MIKMKASKEIIEFTEKVKKYSTDIKLIEELKTKKEVLETQIKDLEKSIKILKLNTIEQNKLLEEITELEGDKKKRKLDLERLRQSFTFIVTTPRPNEASNAVTVCGEISSELSKAQQEVLICSPWITHILDEFSDYKEKDGKKKINLKIITRLIKEDIVRGITDLDKFRILKEYGAEIRYNNDLHAKIVIIDDFVAIISSANLTKNGLSVNYEAGICLKDKNMVAKVARFFNDVWEESKPLTEKSIELCLREKKEENLPKSQKEE